MADLLENWHLPLTDFMQRVETYYGLDTRLKLDRDSVVTRQTLKVAEWHLYGSSRLGIYKTQNTLITVDLSLVYKLSDINLNPTQTLTKKEFYSFDSIYTHKRGDKLYAGSSHLGNVLVTFSDKRLAECAEGQVHYQADVRSATDYAAFGALLDDRQWYSGLDSGGYRYGFNGKEGDNEIIGTGRWQDYGLRVYRTDLGRFFSVDPLASGYPYLTPYQYAANNPIKFIDLDGGEPKSNPEDAYNKIDEFENGSGTSNWSNVNKCEFSASLRQLVADPSSINQSNLTNFCGKAAPAMALGFQDNPVGMVDFLIGLYQNGEATYDNLTEQVDVTLSNRFKSNFSMNITAPAGTTYGTEDAVTVNPAFALFGGAISEKYNWGVDKKYNAGKRGKAGNENGVWASATMGVEKDIVGRYFGYSYTSVGSNFRGLFKGRELREMESGIALGKTVIALVNSSVLHDKDSKQYRLIGTHWIVLMQNQQKWEYGKTECYNRKIMKQSLAGGLIINPATGTGH